MDHTSTTTWFYRVLAHEGDLRAFLARFLAHHEDISDVVQETYARLLALSPERRRAVRTWRAFLFATAHNVVRDHRRKREILSLDGLAEINGADVVFSGGEARRPDEIVNLTQERALLSRVIASLPEKCRKVLTLRKIQGLSQKEIALRLGIAEHTVEKHISYGVRLCAARLLAATGSTRSVAPFPDPGRGRMHEVG